LRLGLDRGRVELGDRRVVVRQRLERGLDVALRLLGRLAQRLAVLLGVLLAARRRRIGRRLDRDAGQQLADLVLGRSRRRTCGRDGQRGAGRRDSGDAQDEDELAHLVYSLLEDAQRMTASPLRDLSRGYSFRRWVPGGGFEPPRSQRNRGF